MERKELLQTLEIVKPALSTKPLIPVFQSFCFSDDTVYAYNDALGIVAPCTSGINVGIPGDTLFGLLSNSRGKNIVFNLDEKKNEIQVKVGSSRIKLPYFTNDEFLFEEPESNWETTLNISGDLLDAFSCCLITASQDTAMKAFMGVTISNNKKNKECTFYSCDGDALTRYIIPSSSKGKGSYIIPSEFCQSVLKLMDKLDFGENGIGTLSVNSEWAYAEFTTGHKIYGRIIEKDDPVDFEKLIEDSVPEDIKFIEIPAGISAALARASIIVDKNTLKTQLTIEDNKMKLHTESAAGVVKDTLKLLEGCEEIDININAELMERSVGLAEHFALCDKCTAYKQEDYFLQILGNLDD